MNSIEYYNKYAGEFFNRTVDNFFATHYEKVIGYLEPNSSVLDAGCGSGRDSLYFKEKGFDVDSFDASIKMVEYSSKLTGLNTKHMTFQELDEVCKYDLVWAAASLLHLDKMCMLESLKKLFRAVKFGGIMFISLKYGTESYYDDFGRYFVEYDEGKLENVISSLSDYEIADIYLNDDTRANKSKKKWINIIVRKKMCESSV